MKFIRTQYDFQMFGTEASDVEHWWLPATWPGGKSKAKSIGGIRH